jgi:hypothetical protein
VISVKNDWGLRRLGGKSGNRRLRGDGDSLVGGRLWKE